MMMAVYNPTPHHTTPHHTTPPYCPKIRIAILSAYRSTLDDVFLWLCIKDPELAARFVIDEENPDYIIAGTHCFTSIDYCKRLRHYLHTRKNSIFIFIAEECIEPDLNIFDYAVCWSTNLTDGDRIIHRIPWLYRMKTDTILQNTLTLEEAAKLLENRHKFCNFIYSHPCEPRDTFFSQLSAYKRVDALGKHLHNTDTETSRFAPDWYALSIDMKRGYKFSMAMENATYRGYTTEKIVSSLEAHTVPIYWGDPAVAKYINPKAFINCHDYGSFDEVIERVKEIDSNDDLWLDMVTQPWQTEEQRSMTFQHVEDYEVFSHNIFTQDIRSARRRPEGVYGSRCQKGWTGYVGIMPPLYLRAARRLRRIAGKFIPKSLKLKLKELLHMA